MVSSTITVTWFIVYVSTLQVMAQITKDSDCSITKECCYFECADSNDCKALVSWVNSGESVAFTLKASIDFESFWFALAFSDDRFMGNDSVTGCKYQSGNTEVFNAMNGARSDPTILNKEGVSFVSSSYKDSIFECTFNRLKAAGIGIVRFHLNQPWYFLFAKGPVLGNALSYHGYDNAISSDNQFMPQFQPKPTTTVLATPAEVTTPVPTTPAQETTSVPTTTAQVTTTVPTTTTQVTTPGPTTTAQVTTPGPTTTAQVTTPGPTKRVVTTPASVIPVVVKVKGCGRTVGCYSDCVGLTCSFIISWTSNNTHAVHTITSNVARNSAQWVAIGFSQDNKMEDDDVMGCISDTSGQVLPFIAWNRKEDTPSMYSDPEIKLIAQKSENSLLSCTFVRPIAANAKRVDVGEAWTMFFAKGPGAIKTPAQIRIDYHHHDRYISTLPLKANDRVDLMTKHSHEEFPLVKAHGCLMIWAWIFFASVGVVVARYYKQAWKSQILSESAWFQIDRACMVLVFCLTASGFIIIFIEVDGYSETWESKKFLEGHPIIGIIVMILTFLNPIMAVFRPHAGTPKRPIFNWAHWFVGTSAPILAVVNIFFGILMTKSDVPYYLMYIMGAFVAWQIFVQLLLEAITRFGKRIEHKEVYEVCNSDVSKTEKDVEGSNIILTKRIILVIHCIIVATFAIALVVLLALGNKHLVPNTNGP